MTTRDRLNTKEGYQEIIEKTVKFQNGFLQKIESLREDERNGIQRFPRKNGDIIKSAGEDILNYQYKIFISRYSSGESMSVLKVEFTKTLSMMEASWKKSNGYVQMVWMLSIGTMLEVARGEMDKLAALVEKENLKDYLIGFLMGRPNTSARFEFPDPYQALKDVIETAATDKKKATGRLQRYLQKEWYKGHSDTGWHDTHKSEFNIHSGYWCFESGALVKILGLDDSGLKDQQYYPYDMVHWKG